MTNPTGSSDKIIYDYVAERGDDWADTITIRSGVIVPPAVVPPLADLTGHTYAMQLRRDYNEDICASVTVDMSQIASSVIVVSLAAAVTRRLSGRYVYDFEQLTPTVRTLYGGSFTFKPDVTRP